RAQAGIRGITGAVKRAVAGDRDGLGNRPAVRGRITGIGAPDLDRVGFAGAVVVYNAGAGDRDVGLRVDRELATGIDLDAGAVAGDLDGVMAGQGREEQHDVGAGGDLQDLRVTRESDVI